MSKTEIKTKVLIGNSFPFSLVRSACLAVEPQPIAALKTVLVGADVASCWLLSPDYLEGFRPAIGVEVVPEQIEGWHVLKLTWQCKRERKTDGRR